MPRGASMLSLLAGCFIHMQLECFALIVVGFCFVLNVVMGLVDYNDVVTKASHLGMTWL
jgi:hypothetical protein